MGIARLLLFRFSRRRANLREWQLKVALQATQSYSDCRSSISDGQGRIA
jgi:hypothetical protein